MLDRDERTWKSVPRVIFARGYTSFCARSAGVRRKRFTPIELTAIYQAAGGPPRGRRTPAAPRRTPVRTVRSGCGCGRDRRPTARAGTRRIRGLHLRRVDQPQSPGRVGTTRSVAEQLIMALETAGSP